MWKVMHAHYVKINRRLIGLLDKAAKKVLKETK